MTKPTIGSASAHARKLLVLELKKISLSLILFIVVFTPIHTLAFKPNTHVWVGQQVLNDVIPNGTVSINGRLYRVADDIVSALRSHPNEYRMGNIGPDAFPDPIVGQMTTHPGVNGGWQADDWLAWNLRGKNTSPRMKAFSYGYLGHAAADTFAHTYVNAYTGDIFNLSDGEQTNEFRHFALEGFIGKYTPPLTDHLGQPVGSYPDVISVPASSVRNHFMLADEVQDQFGKIGLMGSHLVYMKRFKGAILEGKRLSETLPSKFDAQIGLLNGLSLEAMRRGNELGGPIAQAKVQIAAAREVIRRYDDLLAVEENLVRVSEKAILDAINELARLDRRLREIPLEIPGVRRTLNNVLREIDRLERKLKRTICKWARSLCRTLGIDIRDNKRKRDGLASKIYQLGVEFDAVPGKKDEEIQKRIASEAVKAGANIRIAEIRARRAADDTADRALEQAQEILRKLEEEQRKFFAEAVKINNDIMSLKSTLSVEINPLRALFREWEKSIDKATEEYINMSGEIAGELTKEKGEPVKHVRNWLSCYGAVFTPTPPPIPEIACRAKQFYEDIMNSMDRLRRKIRENLGVFAWLVDPFGMLEDEIRRVVTPMLEEAALRIVGVLLGREFENILRIVSDGVTEERLRNAFTEDGGNRGLLSIPDIAARVRSDMAVGTGGASFDGAKFNAVSNSVVLAKLALLDPSELNRVFTDNSRSSEGPFRLVSDFNILVGALKSLDGNHQWNEYGPPYLRRSGRDLSPRLKRTFGYKDGFLLWSSSAGRKQVFPAIFKGPLVPALETPEATGFPNLIPRDYPYRPSKKKPFPKIEDYN